MSTAKVHAIWADVKIAAGGRTPRPGAYQPAVRDRWYTVASPEGPSELMGLVGRVTATRRCTGPVGHHEPASGSVAILCAGEPSPWPIDSRVRVNIAFTDGFVTRWVRIVDAWTERDVVSWDRSRKMWRHTIEYVDVLGYLTGIRTTVALPAQTVAERLDALAALSSDPAMPTSADIGTKWLATPLTALAADTDLATALRGAADAIGHRLMVAATTPDHAPLTLVPDGLSEPPMANWWGSAISAYKRPVELTSGQLQEVPVALSRTSHISRVALGLNVAGADVTELITDAGRYATMQLATPINLATAGTASVARDALRAFATAATAAPAEPALTASPNLIDADTTTAAGALYRLISEPVPLVVLGPTPDQLGPLQICDGYSLTIDPDLTVETKLTLTPASLYGLIPIRAAHIGSRRHTETTTTADGVALPVRFCHLAANRP